MRTFIAIELPSAAQRPLLALLATAPRHESVKWVTAAQLHLTLKFLGEVPDTDLPAVCDAAAEASAALPPFTLLVSGLGVFPAPANPRVLWAGVTDATQSCAQWVQDADPRFAELGYRPEPRAFTPHVTLARSRSTAGAHVLRDVLQTATPPDTEAWQVTEVTVFESRLAPRGATYHPLARVRVGR